MKTVKQVEQTRVGSHKSPLLDSVHRSSLIVPELPGAIAEISFVNHFLIKRGYGHVACRITAIDPEGNRIRSWLEMIAEPRVYRFRLTGSVTVQVASYMVEFFAADNLFIPFPAVMVNHFGETFGNVVHAYNRVLNDVFENDAINNQIVPEASIDISNRPGEDTFVVFSAGAFRCDGQLELELATPLETYRAQIPLQVPRFGQKIVQLREVLPQLPANTQGVLRVQQPPQLLFYGRILAGTRTADGAFSANHSYYDTSRAPEYWEDSRASLRAYPYFADLKTSIRIYPVHSPSTLDFVVTLHGNDGRELGRVPAGSLINPGGDFLDITIESLSSRAGVDISRVRSFVLLAQPQDGATPCRISHQLVYGAGGLEASIAMSLCNPNVFAPQGKHGLTWGQALYGGGLETSAAIVCNTPDGEVAQLDIVAYDEAGSTGSVKRTLVPGGACEIKPEDFGIHSARDDDPRPIWFVVQSPRRDISFYSITRHLKSGHCTGEHGF